MSKIVTTGKRYLKDDRWHDDNGPIAGTPDDWEPEMTDEEISMAALSDPDCVPTPPERLAHMRRVSPAKFARQKLGMRIEDFAAVYGIPLETLRAWERHDAEPTPAEATYLRAILNAPEAVRSAVREAAE